MSPEQEAQLRQLLRMSHKLPEPSWNLFNRTSRRFSRFAETEPKRITKVKVDDKVTKRDKKR